ncbi:Uncharacterized protein AC518_0212 [Pseudomonas syringae pv. syringae]|nr:Uncharacterized protein AC518_0212 [Pseudomonas syringae pv. syringae]
MLLAAQAQTRLSHIVAIRHRRAQLRLLAQQAGLHLVSQHIQRRVVQRQVMKQQQGQPALVGLIPGMNQTHHRCLTNVQTIVPGVETLMKLCRHIGALRVRMQTLADQAGVTPDHLHRLVEAFPGQRGTQDVMALDNPSQGHDEILQTLLTCKSKLRLQYIGVAQFRTEVVVENSRLQGCQRVDVLHVCGAIRHPGNHQVDLRLGQTDQRQQVRGDVFAAFRDQVGRHYDFRAAADRCCQRGQGRLAEQRTHIGTQADLTHALDQRHRQQRVAAQFKEVIMTTDLLDLEYISPDRGQQFFHFALRCFVTTAHQRLRIRHWQGLAVELAVGGQRQ